MKPGYFRPPINRDHPVPVGKVTLTAGEVLDALDMAEETGRATRIERDGTAALICHPDGTTTPRLPAGYLGPPLNSPRDHVLAAFDDLLRVMAGGESLLR